MVCKTKMALFIAAALLVGAAILSPPEALAGSCCGGGSATSLLVPRYGRSVLDASIDLEKYDGFWNQDGKHTPDPPRSDLNQYRLNLGYAHRFYDNWQASISLPVVWNDNQYSGQSSRKNGLGDVTLSLWYEALLDNSAWKVREPADLLPGVTLGASLLVPTGISPYDDVSSSFDVTGRGFYRFDANLLLDKTIQPWNASLALAYGSYLERSVNQEYGKYCEPYRKQLGDRFSAALSLGYNYYLGTGGDTLTGAASYSYLREGDGSINDSNDGSSAFRKQAVGGSLTYSNTDKNWSIRAAWSHAIKADGWGANFPTTDIFSLGVRYVFL